MILEAIFLLQKIVLRFLLRSNEHIGFLMSRGGHAYKTTEELVIALSGSFDVVIDDGKERKTFVLNRSYYGLYIPKGLWREMINFSTNSLALEFASTPYDKNDYIRNYNDFLKLKTNGEI